jgi:hypothetical protein
MLVVKFLILTLKMVKGRHIQNDFFQADVSSKKLTNEFDFTTMIPQVNLFSFVFWKKLCPEILSFLADFLGSPQAAPIFLNNSSEEDLTGNSNLLGYFYRKPSCGLPAVISLLVHTYVCTKCLVG